MGKKIFGLLISIIFIGLVLFQIDLKEVFESFKKFHFAYILIIIPIYYLSFWIRAYRWKIILSGEPSLRIRSLISSLFIGFTANCLLPARMGEFYRAHLFGKKEDIKRAKVFASIVLERILDGTVLFLILLFLICFIYSKPWLFKLAFATGTIFIGGFLFLLVFAKFGKSSSFQQNPILMFFKKFLNHLLNLFSVNFQKFIYQITDKIKYLLNSFIDGLEVFHFPNLLFKSFLLTLLIWLFEGSVVFLVIISFGIPINFLSGLFVLCITSFSTMIPSGPASIGPYQWGYILALGLFGITKEFAFAVSIINQFIAILVITTAGLFFVWKDHINIKDLEKNLELEN